MKPLCTKERKTQLLCYFDPQIHRTNPCCGPSWSRTQVRIEFHIAHIKNIQDWCLIFYVGACKELPSEMSCRSIQTVMYTTRSYGGKLTFRIVFSIASRRWPGSVAPPRKELASWRKSALNFLDAMASTSRKSIALSTMPAKIVAWKIPSAVIVAASPIPAYSMDVKRKMVTAE